MGLFDRIFGRRNQPVFPMGNEFKTLTAYSPTFTSYNGALYESEIIRTAVNARANHCSKLAVQIRGVSNASLRQLAVKPNDFQTWGQMLYRISTILDLDNTCFIAPIKSPVSGHVTGLYPIIPSRANVVDVNGEAYLAFEFREGQRSSAPLTEIGVLTKHQYLRDFFGSDNRALMPTMELINIYNQSVEEASKQSLSYKFYAQINNFAKPEDLAKERERFSENNLKKGSGLLLFPNTYSNITQMKATPYVVDEKQMEQIRTSVYSYFGVNEDILQNKAIGDRWSAFYEGAVEPFAMQLADTLTALLRACGELGLNSEIVCTADRLMYLDTAAKLNMSAQMVDRGILSRNEVRRMWNLPDIDGGDDYIIRAEYITDSVKEENDNAGEN